MRKLFFAVLFVAFGLSAFSMNAQAGEDGCRVTGGGVATAGDGPDGQWDETLAKGKCEKQNGNWNRYTFGGQAGAPTASQPQPFGEWTHHQQSGKDGSFVFHAGTASAPEETEIDWVICSDPGTCKPSGDRPSPYKQIDFAGVGTFKNIKIKNNSTIVGDAKPDSDPIYTLHWFEVHIEDLGEPGKGGKNDLDPLVCPPLGSAGGSASCDCPDFYHIKIYEDTSPDLENDEDPIYEVYGYIKGGNLQIHYPVH